MAADNPVAARVSVPPRNGFVVESPVGRFHRQFATKRSAEAFHEWSEHPTTKLVADVLREYALNQPGPGNIPAGDLTREYVSVQYGITLGLSMAAQFLSDPSSVCAGVFTGSSSISHPTAPLEPTYDTDPATVYFAGTDTQED